MFYWHQIIDLLMQEENRKSENVEHQRLYLTKPKEEKLNSEPPQEEKRVIILDI